jgi:hypothetical protein
LPGLPGFTRMRPMEESRDRKTTSGSVRHPVLLGLFIGTAVGAGYLLSGVPNVELMSLITVLAGAALGGASGLSCGLIAASIYSLGNPLGPPPPLLLAAQAVGLGLVGVLGHVMARPIQRAVGARSHARAVLLSGTTGLLAALIFDTLTNLAIMESFDLGPKVGLLGAVPFFLVHAGVNVAVFAALLPLLLPRFLGLARSPLQGKSSGSALVLLLAAALLSSAATAQETSEANSDSSAIADVPAIHEKPVYPLGWQRPLWRPYLGTIVEEIHHHSPFVAVVDGGLGAPVMVLGAAGSSTRPLFVRDGIPLGTGHALADDSWLMPLQGSVPRYSLYGNDGWGGSGGRIDLDLDDPDPEHAMSVYRGRKGTHETYQRGVSLLSPRADWRLGFDFEESLDIEGYNFTELSEGVFRSAEDFPGHAKIRASHTSLTHRLDEDSRLTFHYQTGRKTRDSAPAWGAEHQEIWDTGIGVRAEGRRGPWNWGTTWFWNDRDVMWGDRLAFGGGSGDLRILETAREGAAIEIDRPLGRARVGLRGTLLNWEVHDSGADWIAADSADLDGDGQQSNLGATAAIPWGQFRLDSGLGVDWDSRCGWGPTGTLRWGPDTAAPNWSVAISRDGRAPRSDEWLTPVYRQIGTRDLFLLPNSELDRERQWQARIHWARQVAGIDLALEGGWSRLREGITWIPLDSNPDRGLWANDLDLDSSRLTVSVAKQGRFVGWASIRLEGTWQHFEVKNGRASVLPPEQFMRLYLGWENHLFAEDGILQLALMSTRRGTMSDPWDVSRSAILPEATLHDLLIGFRLVGTHLSLAYRNLTANRVALTTGALSPGREMDMRLYWVFQH